MSIIIKGIEMPEDCRNCPFETYYMNCGETRCRATGKILADFYKPIPFEGRAEECPIITGDLLKFAKWVAESVCVSDDKWEGDCWAFQEIACRMLVKLGIMEENDGIYSLKQEADSG